MGGLQDHLVAGERKLRLEQALRLALEQRKLPEQLLRVRRVERVGRLLDLVLEEHVAVPDRVGVREVVHRLDVLQVHVQRAAIARGEHFEVAARLEALDRAERVALPRHGEIVRIVAGDHEEDA